jgi:predicted N-acyltransferase
MWYQVSKLLPSLPPSGLSASLTKTHQCHRDRFLVRTHSNSDSSSSDQATTATTPSPPPLDPKKKHDLKLQATLARSIAEIGQEAWDSCHDNSNPFLSYDFLHALEESGSCTPQQGWQPQHFVIRGTPEEEQHEVVLACVPLYLKAHSYGEYVFDSAWGQAYDRHFAAPSDNGYYPKMQSCVPFTPVTGSRILVKPGQHKEEVTRAVANTLGTLPRELSFSSLHCTFNTEEEWLLMSKCGGLRRTGVQYHWHNDRIAHDGTGHAPRKNEEIFYANFADFEAALQQKRRKAIRQERKKVANAGLHVQRLSGADIQDSGLWDCFYEFYLNTIDRKWGTAYLTREFFELISERMSDKILLVTAEESNSGAPGAALPLPTMAGAAARGGKKKRPIAAALNLLGTDAIYGRNWGCVAGDEIKGLHFELCFYQAIEHAIENKFSRVEAGAQGEHKLARGYVPKLTYSSHFIVNDGFRYAIEDFLRQERSEIEYYSEIATRESPYK